MMLSIMPEPRNSLAEANVDCALYLHVPFCETKCGYCDFYSVAVRDRETAPLVERVARELRQRVADNPRKIRTIFWGGGTPTILPLQQLSALLESVAASLPLANAAEFTIEANPATVDDDKVKLLVAGGVTRASMGAQSFFPQELATLERIHSPDDIAPSVERLRRNGVVQVNIDLIFGIPGQTLDSWSRSLRRAIELQPDHIACYGLTYEPGTPLYEMRRSGRIKPVSEQLEADMYLRAVDALAAAGYEQYETSNFAKPGFHCLHNLIYWRNGSYIGVGPSAAGYIDGRRYKNVADVDEYIRRIDADGHAEAESEIVDTRMLATEMIMMQLRLVEGLSIQAFRRRIGVDPVARFGRALERLVELGHVTVTDGHIALTRTGRLISDAVMAELASAVEDVPDPLTPA
jgi:oxygen-independent coproporphyrinogen-3 oxidase